MEQSSRKSLTWLITFLVIALIGSRSAFAAEPAPTPFPALPTDLAKRISEVTDAVLDHHINPPARQQMILGGIKALYRSAGLPLPYGLGRRVSAVQTPEQLASFLAEIWPRAAGKSSQVDQIDVTVLDGLLSEVSGGTRLISAKERKVAEQFHGNRYVGIQIALSMDEKEKLAAIHEVFEGGPADRAGVKKGDLVERVDDVDTRGMTLQAVVERIRGDDGTKVTLKVRQPNERNSRTLTMTRGQLPRATVQGVHKRQDGSWDVRLAGTDAIGYLRITQINASTPHELRKLASQLDNPGNWGLVLDLRGLGGTSVHESVLLADSLLAGGVIGRVQTAQRELTYQADSDALFRTATIAVLVDHNTDGTAEWLAAALQDNHRAIVVGTPTFSAANAGARTDAWSIVTVGDGTWSIQLATGRLKRGDGRPIGGDPRIGASGEPVRRASPASPDEIKTGVKPDHIVGGNPTDARRLRPPGLAPSRRGDSPNQEPNPASDEILREAVRLLHESIQKFI
jgi:carboxyl-terminal processing protease